MPRRMRRRRVLSEPDVVFFKPQGIPMRELEEVVLTIDEYEALRLCDFDELNQEQSAKKMKVSQPTFNRLIISARKKTAEALVKGKAIKIEGGNYFISRK